MRFSWLFLPVLAWAQCADYTVRFSVFGTIGTVKVCYASDGNNYVMDVDGRTTGVAALLSEHRREHTVSQGRIIAGAYRPQIFVYDYRDDSKTRFIVYRFDHQHKKVNAETVLLKHDTRQRYTARSLSLKTETSDAFSNWPWQHVYIGEDIISLYLNRLAHLAQKTGALGLGKNMERFEITRLSEAEKRENSERFGMPLSDCFTFRATQKDAGMDVCLDEAIFPAGVVIKNILILGSIVAVRERTGGPRR